MGTSPGVPEASPKPRVTNAHLEVWHGPILVLAPAGSGKTRTLTARIARLAAAGIPAGRILALAFNERAAGEMAGRLAALVPGDVQVRTFHSLGYEIVRDARGWKYSPKNEEKARRLAEEIVWAHLRMPEHPGERHRLEGRALTVDDAVALALDA